jgi:hypothetical protein
MEGLLFIKMLIAEKIFLIGQSQKRTAYSSHGNFVQVKRFQRRRFFLEIDQTETKIAYGGHVC